MVEGKSELIHRFRRILKVTNQDCEEATTTDYAPNTVCYSDKKATRVAELVGAIIASLLPVLAIVILYLVKSMAKRLGLVALFTSLFSVSLWFMTDRRLLEVFAATST